MPDFAVASSKRIALGPLVFEVCASKQEDTKIGIRNRTLNLMSSRRIWCGGARHVGWGSRFQQDLRDSIFWSGLWSSVAADARTLFATAHPEKSGFALESFAGGIEQLNL